MSTIKDLLLQAPDNELDASVFPLIEKWDEPPTTLQVLEVLDHCVYFAAAGPFVMGVLNTLLQAGIDGEETTYEEVVAKATWRNEPPFTEPA